MSNYGPQGGPYPGQPQDPYGQPADPWGSGGQDPWGAGGPPTTGASGGGGYGQQPGYDQPQYGGQGGGGGYRDPSYGYEQGGGAGYGGSSGGYGGSSGGYGGSSGGYGYGPSTSPAWTGHEPPMPEKKNSTGLIITVVTVLALLICGGGLAAFLIFGGDDDTSTGALPTNQVSAPPPGSEVPRTETPTAPPSPTSSADARFATKGACLKNDGSNAKPQMRIVTCGPGTYEVLARFERTTAWEDKCKPVQGYTHHYYYDSALDVLDFVLCMKER